MKGSVANEERSLSSHYIFEGKMIKVGGLKGDEILEQKLI
jgi:hypothetical protein